MARGDAKALAEWAVTTEGTSTYASLLVEGAWSSGRVRPYVRLERTDRPEQAREADLFRSVRTHGEADGVGVSRFAVVTAGVSAHRRSGPVAMEWAIEATVTRVRRLAGGQFDPERFYGSATPWSVTAGLRIRLGQARGMGRYGVAEEYGEPHGH